MLKFFLRSATAKDTSFLFVGSIISSVAGIVLLILLARIIPQTELGFFTTALVFSQLLADMFELGINPATLTFLSQKEQKKEITSQSFILKISFAILVMLGSFILAPFLAKFVFNNLDMENFIKVSGIGAALLMLIAWCQNIFQAERKFLAASLLNTSTNIFRLVIVAVALVAGIKSGLSIFFLFQVVLIFSLIFFGFKLRGNLRTQKFNLGEIKSLLKFGLPIGLGFSLAAIYSKLDQILVFNLAGEKEAAVYGISSRLMIIIVYAIASFNSAIIVRFASMEKENFQSYFKKTWAVIVGTTGIIGIGILLSPILIPVIFGQTYIPAIVPFQILALGIIFFILSIPLNNVILYRRKKSYFSLYLSIISLVLTWFLLQYFIPLYQSTGAAIAMCTVYFVQLIISLGFYWKFRND